MALDAGRPSSPEDQGKLELHNDQSLLQDQIPPAWQLSSEGNTSTPSAVFLAWGLHLIR